MVQNKKSAVKIYREFLSVIFTALFLLKSVLTFCLFNFRCGV